MRFCISWTRAAKSRDFPRHLSPGKMGRGVGRGSGGEVLGENGEVTGVMGAGRGGDALGWEGVY